MTYSQTSYTPGQCTWYVAGTNSWIPPGLGNAAQWLMNAPAKGLRTGRTPEAGAVAVLEPGRGQARSTMSNRYPLRPPLPAEPKGIARGLTAIAREVNRPVPERMVLLRLTVPLAVASELMRLAAERGIGLDEAAARALTEGWLAPVIVAASGSPVEAKPSKPARAVSEEAVL